MSRRDDKNWFAFGLSLAYILCYLVLPYYLIYVLAINGWTLISLNALMCLPLILGMLMAFASLLFDVRVGVGIAAVSVLANFVLMLVGKSVLSPTVVLQQNIASLVSQAIDFTQPIYLQLTVGIGAILSLLFAIAILVTEILALLPKKHYKPIDYAGIDF